MRTRNSRVSISSRHVFIAILVAVCSCSYFSNSAAAQGTADSVVSSRSRFRVGERLTYNVSVGKFTSGAYVEMAVVSHGNLSGTQVVELRSTLKTLGVVSAAFYQFDEKRTVYAAVDTGLPVYISKTTNFGVEPKETVDNFLKAPTTSFDMLSMIYKIRESRGVGSFPLLENGQRYTVTFRSTISEKVKAEAGEFVTLVSEVQSDYLAAIGIKDLKINFTADQDSIPVLIRFKTAKGIVNASIAAIQIPKPTAAPTPETPKTPSPAVTPPPKPTPPPYIENQPILPELGFALGETLNYDVSESGKKIAVITLSAKERKLFNNEDSLLLTATVTGTEQGNTMFGLGDSIQVQVDPDTLAPRWVEARFSRDLKWLNKIAVFDPRTGNISVGKEISVDAPVGTHSLLSLIYAMRSFNLKPSKDPKNPVNDTRVAVFWETEPNVFILVPSNPEEITLGGEKILAQMISITTGNETFDKRSPKIWLDSNERIPLRFVFGNFQADLVLPPKNLSK
ncbi:MAG: DUF3108 domain-containing protein [Chloracidobacterium sp.]|nr:DUF3108 domain-containing protein [Chloracidobacterium sp.]